MYLLLNVLSIAITHPYDNALIILANAEVKWISNVPSCLRGYSNMINYMSRGMRFPKI